MSFERPNGPTFFGDKDTLPTGNGDKVIKGSEVDADFNAISTELNEIDAWKEAQLESNQNAYDELVKHELRINNHEERLDLLDGGETGDDPELVLGKLHVKGLISSDSSTELGDSNDDQHVFHGDVYVGYTDPSNVPDTSLGDVTPGTLFLSRGVKLVQDPASNDGHIPSFNAGGFKVVNLGRGVNNQDSINFEQFNEFKQAQLGSNQNVYDYLVRMSLILESSSTFEEYKQNMLANLRSTIESMEA